MDSDEQDSLLGQRVGKDGRLELQRQLGEGASGSIWLAQDHKRDRLVAVKFLHLSMLDNENLRARFLREGKTFGKLRHDNLVRVHGLGHHHGQPYLVIEYVDGQTLWDLIERGWLFEPDQALAIARDIASGLAAAHAAGVIHRDLKPSNIMIREEDQRVKVLDFGIAKDLHADTAITRIGAYIGTPAYSAPEQILGEQIDPRTDIYSLGVILYELLTGPLTLAGRQTTEMFRATLNERNIPLGDLHAHVSRPVARLIQRMTRRRAERRPPDMDNVREECMRLIGVMRDDVSGGDKTAIRTVLRDLFESE
ncbi:MAG: serine/threonine-protein kinase [Planctomycetota bacterium]|nr:serine/threonine-protein kinase [Planctomycetota bacterium]